MGFLTFIQRKTNPKKYSQPQRKAPPYECRISPKSPVRLVHPTTSTVSRNGSTYSHLPLPDRTSLFPAHDVEPRSHSSPGLPLPRIGDNTQAMSTRPRSSLAGKASQANSPLPQLMTSHRPHTSLSSRRMSSSTSTGRNHIDLLDAQSEFKPPDFYGRVRASGVRDYGEDVADRNIGTNGCSLGSPLAQSFFSNSSDAGQPARTPLRHASLSGRASIYHGEDSDRSPHVQLEAAPKPPRLTRKKKAIYPSSISSFAMQSLAELDAILPPEMESQHTEREHPGPSTIDGSRQFENTSLRLENNNSTDSFACPPPAIPRSAGSRDPGQMSQSPNQSQNTPFEVERTSSQLRAVFSNQAPSILFSAAEEGASNKRHTVTYAMSYDGHRDVPDATICLTETSLDQNDGFEGDVLGRELEETTSSHASSLHHWSTAPLTPTTSSSNSDSTLRTPSRQTANTSIDLGTAAFSPAVAQHSDSVCFNQLHTGVPKKAKTGKRQTPGPQTHDSAFNIDDYVIPDDESLLGCEEQPESEDLLFAPGYGKFGTGLPGLQDIFMAPAPSNLLRSLEACVEAKPPSEDGLNDECPSLCVSRKDGLRQRKIDGASLPSRSGLASALVGSNHHNQPTLYNTT